MDEKHIPGQDPIEVPAPAAEEPASKEEAPKPEAAKDEKPAPAKEEGEKSDEDTKAPEDKKPEDEKPKDPEPQLPKKRSIYKDLKDKKHELKDTRTELDQVKGRNAELEDLLAKKDDAATPKEKSEVAADIATYAEKYGLDAEGLSELTAVILKSVPTPDYILTPEEAAEWRAGRAQSHRDAEDQQILSLAPSVKTQLAIHDDAELQNVMKEVVRLAHTPEFHDKEVEYIIWKSKDALSKLVSPKKPSFEQGGQRGEAAAAEEIDFSSGKVTPEQAGRSIVRRSDGLEVRKGS